VTRRQRVHVSGHESEGLLGRGMQGCAETRYLR
jgi:hypothetical protein